MGREQDWNNRQCRAAVQSSVSFVVTLSYTEICNLKSILGRLINAMFCVFL